MKKIEKLTKQQEALVPIYLKRWKDIGYSTNPIDQHKTVESIKWLYTYGKKEKMPYVWFCDSPMQIQLILNVFKNEKYMKLLGDNLWTNLWNNFWNNLGANLGTDLGDNLRDNLRANLGTDLRDNLWDNLGANLGTDLRANLGTDLRANLGANLWDNLGANLGANLGTNLWLNLRANLWANLWVNLWDNLGNNLGNNLGDNLRDNLRANFGTDLRANLRDNLRANLGANFGTDLRANLRDNLWNNKLEFNYFFSPNLESYWVGFYDFILHEIFPHRTTEFKEFSHECKEFHKNVYHIVPFDNICFVSERPTKLKTKQVSDGRTVLHNDSGPVLEYKDGYKFYALNGVRMPDWVLNQPKENLSSQDILQLNNAEQRMQAMKHKGLGHFFSQLKSEVLDKKDGYELLLVDLDGEKCEHLKMINPSTGEIHLEGILPGLSTVDKALAWRNGLEYWINPTTLT